MYQSENKLKTRDIKKIFDIFFNYQKNFMSPNPIRYGIIKNSGLIYEISMGTFLDKELYGFTSLFMEKKRLGEVETLTISRTDLNECFSTLGEVEEYIEGLSKRFQ